jgi:hypothetical protein
MEKDAGGTLDPLGESAVNGLIFDAPAFSTTLAKRVTPYVIRDSD